MSSSGSTTRVDSKMANGVISVLSCGGPQGAGPRDATRGGVNFAAPPRNPPTGDSGKPPMDRWRTGSSGFLEQGADVGDPAGDGGRRGGERRGQEGAAAATLAALEVAVAG